MIVQTLSLTEIASHNAQQAQLIRPQPSAACAAARYTHHRGCTRLWRGGQRKTWRPGSGKPTEDHKYWRFGRSINVKGRRKLTLKARENHYFRIMESLI
jgi:hypothetical protein